MTYCLERRNKIYNSQVMLILIKINKNINKIKILKINFKININILIFRSREHIQCLYTVLVGLDFKSSIYFAWFIKKRIDYIYLLSIY